MKTLYIVHGNVNGCSNQGKCYGSCSKEYKWNYSYDPEIPLLSLHMEKTKPLIKKDTRTPVAKAALLTVAKTWQQPKCPSTDR